FRPRGLRPRHLPARRSDRGGRAARRSVRRAEIRTARPVPLQISQVGRVLPQGVTQAFDLSLFWDYRAILIKGFGVNVLVFLAAAVLALAAGLGAALLRVNRFPPLRWLGTIHVELFRNAPDYIMLAWVHFVLPLLIALAIRRRVEFDPFASAVLALGLV